MTENITQTPAYRVAFSMYVALGGDKTRIFDSVEAIYAEIDKFYGKGSRITTEALNVEITENISELYNDDTITGYKPVSIKVNVPQKYTDEQVESLVAEATLNGYNDGYVEGEVAGVEAQKDRLIDIEITQNGTYTREDGYENITVTVDTGISDEEFAELIKNATDEGYQDGYSEGLEDGAEDQKALLESLTVSENGTYTKENGWNEVIVEVASSGGGGGLDWTPTGYDDTQTAFCYSTIEDDIAYAQTVKTKFNATGSSSNKSNALAYDGKLVYAPILICGSTVTKARDVFHHCGALKYVPRFSTVATEVCYTHGLFGECISLRKIDRLEIPNATSAKKMFYYCNNLESVPLFDTSKVTTMEEMFKMSDVVNNSALTTVPLFNTSKVTTMTYMFYYCTSLTNVPAFNTSSCTNMSYMFSNCRSLTAAPEFTDTSKVTTMARMFMDCSSLKGAIPAYNTSKVTTMAYMFQNAIGITSLPEFDCSSLQTMTTFLGGSTAPKFISLTTMGGFKNLGMVSNFNAPSDYYFMYQCPNLTKESLLNVLNGLYDRASAGYSILSLRLHSNHLAMLSDEEKAIATNKGWTLI